MVQPKAAPRYAVVLAGVDTLKASARGTLKPSVAELFDALQQKALEEREQRIHKGEAMVDTHFTLDGGPLLMLPHGGGHGQWRWLAKCPAASFEFGLGHLNDIGCQVRLSSTFLWRRGYRTAWQLVERFLAPLFDKETWFQLSELHLCADIAGLDVDQLKEREFVTRSQVTRWHHEDALILDLTERRTKSLDRPIVDIVRRYRQQETANFSLKSPHAVVIYNKPREIRVKSKDKAWFLDLWERNGWDGRSPIARVEIRYLREALHELQCEGVRETFGKLDSLWQYSTQQWIRHTVPTKQESKRWPTSPWWQVVQAATFERQDAEPAQRVKQRNFKESAVLSALLGYTESWMAWRAGEQGVPDGMTISDALETLQEHADRHYQARGSDFYSEVVRKRKALGFTR